MAFTFWFFENSYVDLVTVTFTALIVAELLNVYSELHMVKLITIVA